MSDHNIFCKQKILKFSCKQTNKIQGETMQPLKTLKPFWHYLTSHETAFKFMNIIGPLAKYLRIFYFQKRLWLDNPFPRVPVWVYAL